MMKKLVLVTAALVGISLSAACSSDTVVDDTAAIEVDVGPNNVFTPKDLTVKVGQTVRWVWKGGSHDVVSGSNCTEDGNFKSGAPRAGGTFDKQFETVGTFPYFCTPHCSLGMVGTITVTP